MTMRRQALRSCEPSATCFLLCLISIFFFTLPSILAKADSVMPGAPDGSSAAQSKIVNPGDMNTGALLFQSGEGGFVGAPRLATDVTMTVNGTIGGGAPVDTMPSPTVVPSDSNAGEAEQPYPVLPLTVVPKPEIDQLAPLKAPQDLNQRLAIVALILAFLSAITFVFWRYHRRDYASPRRIGRRI